jgi:hypothetical protein
VLPGSERSCLELSDLREQCDNIMSHRMLLMLCLVFM